MQEKLSIKEASELTGKHQDTIRRLIKTNTGNKNITKTKKGYLLNKDWLIGQYEGVEDSVPSSPAMDSRVDNDVLSVLSAQLQAKDNQINALQEIIKEKEANTTKLQDQFQQLLAVKQLPEATPPVMPDTIKTSTKRKAPRAKTTPPAPRKTKAKPRQTQKPTAKKVPVAPAPKSRWWRRG